MIKTKQKHKIVENWVNEVSQHILPELIWQNELGEYEVFGKYRIVPQLSGFCVFINEDAQGFFNSTRTAISWCIADKFQQYNLARDLLTCDNMLANLTNDIFVRAGVANKTRDPNMRESIDTKLELKILHKKKLASQLNNYVNRAKYLQQKGFANETSRFGSATTIKTNR